MLVKSFKITSIIKGGRDINTNPVTVDSLHVDTKLRPVDMKFFAKCKKNSKAFILTAYVLDFFLSNS